MSQLIQGYPNINGNKEIYLDCLNAIIGESNRNSMIDLGCNKAPHTPLLGFEYRAYIDILPRQLDYPDEQRFFTQKDILTIDSTYRDVSFALDVIEHLTVDDGYKLLKVMESISDKQILFTPTTDLFGMAQDGDKDPEAHRSLWEPEMTPDYACLVFTEYHKVWNGGAYFLWKCKDLENEFNRVVNELKTKSWNK
jgi:hypothetical protein